MLPNVDIDSISGGSVSVNHVLPEPKPARCPADAVIQVLIGLNVCEFDFFFFLKKNQSVLLNYCHVISLFCFS